MGYCVGEPFSAELNSADASAGVEIPVRKQGSETNHTLAAHEYLEITDMSIVSAPGGDIFVHTGTAADTTPADHKTVLRGTVAANGGLARGSDYRFVAIPGDKMFAVAPVGVVDVVVKGFIRETGERGRVSWRESLVPGQ